MRRGTHTEKEEVKVIYGENKKSDMTDDCMNKFKSSSSAEMCPKQTERPLLQTSSERSRCSQQSSSKKRLGKTIEQVLQGDTSQYSYEGQQRNYQQNIIERKKNDHVSEAENKEASLKERKGPAKNQNSNQQEFRYNSNERSFSHDRHSANTNKPSANIRQQCQPDRNSVPLRQRLSLLEKSSQCDAPPGVRSQQGVSRPNSTGQTLKVSNLETLVIQPGSPTVIKVQSSKSKEELETNVVEIENESSTEEERDCEESGNQMSNEDYENSKQTENPIRVNTSTKSLNEVNYNNKQPLRQQESSRIQKNFCTSRTRHDDQPPSNMFSPNCNGQLNTETMKPRASSAKSDKRQDHQKSSRSNNSQSINTKSPSHNWQHSTTDQDVYSTPSAPLPANSSQCSQSSKQNYHTSHSRINGNKLDKSKDQPKNQTLKISNLDTVVIQPGSPTLIQLCKGGNKLAATQDLVIESEEQCYDPCETDFGVVSYGDGPTPKSSDYPQSTQENDRELKQRSSQKRSKTPNRSCHWENEGQYQRDDTVYNKEHPQLHQDLPPLQQLYQTVRPPQQQTSRVPPPQKPHTHQAPSSQQYQIAASPPPRGRPRYNLSSQNPNCRCVPSPNRGCLKHNYGLYEEYQQQQSQYHPLPQETSATRSQTQLIYPENPQSPAQHQYPPKSSLPIYTDTHSDQWSHTARSQYHSGNQYDTAPMPSQCQNDYGFGDGQEPYEDQDQDDMGSSVLYSEDYTQSQYENSHPDHYYDCNSVNSNYNNDYVSDMQSYHYNYDCANDVSGS